MWRAFDLTNGTINRASVVEFLEAELGVDLSDVANGDPLFSTGIVDSFALVTLMMYLEQQGGFRINPGDVTLDNFDTIDRIVAFCNRALV
ncbi:MAG: acyl carrier protein [Mangrovicoccus sp.]|nr:acyl carrier protein [Mangrovicoccus sp.]